MADDKKNLTSELNAFDCISRQAAMEDISKQQTYKMFEGEDTLYLDANDVGSVLASLPSVQPEPQWIPCSERPPEVENNVAKRVIVTTSWNMVCEAHYCVDHWEMNDIDYKLSSVIAWMPLPEPFVYERNEKSL